MLRSKATAIRAVSGRDDLLREARRLGNVVTNLPRAPRALAEEAAAEIDAATRQIDEIGRLARSVDGAAEPQERATTERLRELGVEARRRRRRLRTIRRRLRSEQAYDELAA